MRRRIIALEIVPLCILFILIIIRFSKRAAPATPPNPPSWNQMGKGIDGEGPYDRSGWSVSLSENGEIVAIGAYGNDGNGDDSGHVRIFKYDPYEFLWGQIGADIDGEAEGDESGSSVSLSGNGEIVAIGAEKNDGNGIYSGHVRVFKWNKSNFLWDQMGDDIDGEAKGDYAGSSVSLSSNGQVVAIGAMFNDGTYGEKAWIGHVRIFRWNNSGLQWDQMGADIDGEIIWDSSGESVSLSSNGEIVAIGAPTNDGNGGSNGHVRIFKWNASKLLWVQMGADIDGEASGSRPTGDYFGESVSLSSNGEIVAIGAPYNDGNGDNSGHVRIFKWNNSRFHWDQMGAAIHGEANGDNFGSSVSLSGNGEIVAVGAPDNDGNGWDYGHVRIFKWNNSRLLWEQMGEDIYGETRNDGYDPGLTVPLDTGLIVSLSENGEIVAIGAGDHDESDQSWSHQDIGRVRIFKWNN